MAARHSTSFWIWRRPGAADGKGHVKLFRADFGLETRAVSDNTPPTAREREESRGAL